MSAAANPMGGFSECCKPCMGLLSALGPASIACIWGTVPLALPVSTPLFSCNPKLPHAKVAFHAQHFQYLYGGSLARHLALEPHDPVPAAMHACCPRRVPTLPDTPLHAAAFMSMLTGALLSAVQEAQAEVEEPLVPPRRPLWDKGAEANADSSSIDTLQDPYALKEVWHVGNQCKGV